MKLPLSLGFCDCIIIDVGVDIGVAVGVGLGVAHGVAVEIL